MKSYPSFCHDIRIRGTSGALHSPDSYTAKQLATQHLAIATTMYREMDMRFWLEQAEVVSNEFGVR